MKKRLITLAALVGWLVLVVAVGGSAVNAGASQPLVGGIEVAALVAGLVVAIVVRAKSRA